MVEGAALDVLAAEPNVAVLARRRRGVLARIPVQRQRREREELRGAPVHAELAVHHLSAVFQQLARVRVRDKVRGEQSHVLQPRFSSHVVELRKERLGGANGIAHADAVVLLRLCPRSLVVQVVQVGLFSPIPAIRAVELGVQVIEVLRGQLGHRVPDRAYHLQRHPRAEHPRVESRVRVEALDGLEPTRTGGRRDVSVTARRCLVAARLRHRAGPARPVLDDHALLLQCLVRVELQPQLLLQPQPLPHVQRAVPLAHVRRHRPILGGFHVRPGRVELSLVLGGAPFDPSVNLRPRRDAVGHEPVGVNLRHFPLPLDPLRQQRKRDGRVVLFVVPEAPVAHQVDHHVLAL